MLNALNTSGTASQLLIWGFSVGGRVPLGMKKKPDEKAKNQGHEAASAPGHTWSQS